VRQDRTEFGEVAARPLNLSPGNATLDQPVGPSARLPCGPSFGHYRR
jgi:hypothetical protein